MRFVPIIVAALLMFAGPVIAQEAAETAPAAPPAPVLTFKTTSTIPMPQTLEVDNSVSCRLMDGGQTIFCTAAPRRDAPPPAEKDEASNE